MLWQWLAVVDNSLPLNVNDIDNAPARLPVPVGFDFSVNYEKLTERLSQLSDENTGLKEQCSKLRSSNATRQLLDELIKPFAHKVFWFMCAYCGSVLTILVLCGFDLKFSLPANVLSLLVGSTAVTVIGLVGMVLTGVFVGARR